MKKQIFFAILILGIVALFVMRDSLFKKEIPVEKSQAVNQEQFDVEKLRIISTNPDPLEGATILPTQNIEFKFNKQIAISEFKHKFDPEVDHEVEAVYDKINNTTTVKIKFNKPLNLGSGYTLFVLSNTNSEDGKQLGREYDYHFSTIKYRGV